MACTTNTQLITYIVCEIKITCGFELIIVLLFVNPRTYVIWHGIYVHKINYYSFLRWWPVHGKLMVSYTSLLSYFCGSTKGKGSFSVISDNRCWFLWHTGLSLAIKLNSVVLRNGCFIFSIVASLLYIVKTFYVWDNVVWRLDYRDFKILSSATRGAMCMWINRSRGMFVGFAQILFVYFSRVVNWWTIVNFK